MNRQAIGKEPMSRRLAGDHDGRNAAARRRPQPDSAHTKANKRPLEPWRYNPSCPPNWRQKDGLCLAMGQPPQWSSDDAAVLEYLAYLRQMMTASPQNGQGSSHLGSSAIGEAQALAHEDGPRRWEVEARLLAGQTDEEIAGHCNLPSQAVAQYEAIFFHVREIRRAIDYLLVHVIGDGPRRGFRNHEVRNFWAWVALAVGPVTLDLLIRTFHAARQPDQPATLSVYLQPRADVPLNLQALVATMALPPCWGDKQAFLVLHLRLLEALTTVNSRRREFLFDQTRQDLVRCIRAYLVGKPLPKPRRYSQTPRRHGPGHS